MDVYQPVEPRRDAPRSREATGETAFPPPVLGWYHLAVNSFAPLGNLITTATEEPRTRKALLPAIQAGMLSEAEPEALRPEDVTYRSLGLELGRHQIPSLGEIFGEVEPLLQGLRYRFLTGAQPAPTLRRSRIETAREVDAFAQTAGARADVSVVGELCLRLLPETEDVFVTVTHDPEDGTAGLHFRVRTSAPIDTVVAAEDRLHEALFERISSARRSLFSIGYEFVRRTT